MGCAGSKSSKKKLSHDDMAFLEENTDFSREQIKEWYEGFIGDCPTGELTRKKFVEVYKQFFPTGNSEAFCEHIFRTFDSDNSGKIDFREFLLALNITSKGTPEKKLDWAFKMYDIDGNGSIEKDEMLKIVKSIYELIGDSAMSAEDSAEERTESIFRMMDINKDGVLCRDEFIQGCLQDKYLYQMLTADTS